MKRSLSLEILQKSGAMLEIMKGEYSARIMAATDATRMTSLNIFFLACLALCLLASYEGLGGFGKNTIS